LDERRAKFKANVWNRPVHGEDLLSITDQEAARRVKKAEKTQGKHKDKHRGHLHRYEAQFGGAIRHETDVEEVSCPFPVSFIRSNSSNNRCGTQVWFAGCHCGALVIAQCNVDLIDDT
jgi:hypothetical protein